MITAVILTKNEEKNIKNCLDHLKWCSEIILIDDYSTDKTIKIARQALRKFKAKIFKRHLNNNFAAQRNFGAKHAAGDWVLFVDADEIVSPKLRNEITKKITKNNKTKGYYLKRTDYFMGKPLAYGETASVKLLRLAQIKSGQWKRKVHEYWNVKGEVECLENHLLHFPHPSLSEFITDINFYSTLHAAEIQKEGKKATVFKVIFYPLAKFFLNYFVKLGFLDGKEGFTIAIIMSFHSFLSWSKSWMD